MSLKTKKKNEKILINLYSAITLVTSELILS